MAVAFVRDHLDEFVKAAGTTDTYALTADVPAGNLLVAVAVHDNATGASKPVISSISKMSGETNDWLFLGAARSTLPTSPGVASDGEMWAIKTSVQWTNGTSLTFTYDTSCVMKSQDIIEFSGAEATLRSTVGTAYSTSTTAASATTTGTTPVIGDLAVGLVWQSNSPTVPAGDNDTTGGSWSAVLPCASSGSTANSNNAGGSQYKILTGANHQTFNNQATLTANNGAVVAVLQASIDPLVTQAAYRLYDDGTETGATALAAQDTAATADLTSGDVNLQVRVRLQETAGSPLLAATDDWQLQYKRGGGEYDLSNADTVSSLYNTHPGIAQSFIAAAGPLTTAAFMMAKNATPTGTVSASLWAHDGGTFGGTGLPTGAALATSTNSVTVSALTTTSVATTFTFDGTVTLTAGTPYFIGLTATGAAASPNAANIGLDGTSATDPGKFVNFNGSTWSVGGVFDLCYEVNAWTDVASGGTVNAYASANLTDAAATTNRLGSGTGTFVAGEISETGLVTDLGWTASNHTELLYSITLKQADLANGDTLKFRVLRNAATTGLTYTQTPTINITIGAAAYVPPHITTSNIATVTRSYYY